MKPLLSSHFALSAPHLSRKLSHSLPISNQHQAVLFHADFSLFLPFSSPSLTSRFSLPFLFTHSFILCLLPSLFPPSLLHNFPSFLSTLIFLFVFPSLSFTPCFSLHLLFTHSFSACLHPSYLSDSFTTFLSLLLTHSFTHPFLACLHSSFHPHSFTTSLSLLLILIHSLTVSIRPSTLIHNLPPSLPRYLKFPSLHLLSPFPSFLKTHSSSLRAGISLSRKIGGRNFKDEEAVINF